MDVCRLGVIPTRRHIFSREDALHQKEQLYAKLRELQIEFTDIEEINEEGLLFAEGDVCAVIEKLRSEKVDALFFPHCNFGSEDLVGKVAKAMNKPVLLWGPLDGAPLADGTRLRDTQCGLFASGKVLRRFCVPFSYMNTCTLEDPYFAWRLKNFIAAANVVKRIEGLTILQISTRPADFWTMMVNEGELLERFNIRVHPISLQEIKTEMQNQRSTYAQEVERTIAYMKETMVVEAKEEALAQSAALTCAMRALLKRYGCQAAAIQCWHALQDAIGIFPCAANALLGDEGYPITCETDIHGAITAIFAQAAAMGEQAVFFADWTIPHPDHPNGELLQHCGPWPISLMKEKPRFAAPFAFHNSHPGALHGEMKGGAMSILRFDGDQGAYSLLMGHAKGIEGPYSLGTYCWVEVENLRKLEAKLVEGPYVHHCVGIHRDVLPVLHEALKYFPHIKADYVDTDEEAMNALLRGECL